VAIEAVLFDFSGTLFRWEDPGPGGADVPGTPLPGADLPRGGLADAEGALGGAVPAGRVFDPEQVDPACWAPYPDTDAVLSFLAAHGIPVGVVSNLAADPRQVLAAHGWDARVEAVAVAHEIGARKPEPLIFRAALDELGVAPEAALMVGDSPVTDGGATELGCRFALVDPLPVAQRPDALIDALRAHGLAVPR